jgi:prepilin-type N-terminal cleavage/methylation domain-containing protein
MLKAWAPRQNGFTIVELLIVIVVIAILATIALVAYNGVQARARDSIRKSDLATIKKALTLYNTDTGSWIGDGSGCGGSGNGQYWFNYSNGTTYPVAIATCLTNAGYTNHDIIDPTGGKTSSPTSGYAYMQYHCGSGATEQVYLYAKLETEPQSSTATDGTCNVNLDISYGMNYYVQVR